MNLKENKEKSQKRVLRRKQRQRKAAPHTKRRPDWDAWPVVGWLVVSAEGDCQEAAVGIFLAAMTNGYICLSLFNEPITLSDLGPTKC